jgi:hypothetical protein
VLAASPAHSDVIEAKGEKMLQRDYTPQSRIAQTLKDAELILDEARRHGQRLPLMELNAAILAACIESGGPDRDSSAVIEARHALPPQRSRCFRSRLLFRPERRRTPTALFASSSRSQRAAAWTR